MAAANLVPRSRISLSAAAATVRGRSANKAQVQMADRYTELRARLPPSYVGFIEAHDGWEGDLGDDLGYVVIWGRETIQERWDGYEMAHYLSERWFPFGSDGGGEMLCFDLGSGTDQVFYIPYIGMADEEAMPRHGSFTEVAEAIRKGTDEDAAPDQGGM